MPLTRRLARFEEPAFAILRVVSGILFSLHGMQKIFGWLGGEVQEIGSQMWIGGLIELGGLFIALGLFTRPVAFLASGTMAVAYVQFHWELEMADWMWAPAANGGDAAVVYSFLFLFFVVRGPGPYSLDARIRGA